MIKILVKVRSVPLSCLKPMLWLAPLIPRGGNMILQGEWVLLETGFIWYLHHHDYATWVVVWSKPDLMCVFTITSTTVLFGVFFWLSPTIKLLSFQTPRPERDVVSLCGPESSTHLGKISMVSWRHTVCCCCTWEYNDHTNTGHGHEWPEEGQ